MVRDMKEIFFVCNKERIKVNANRCNFFNKVKGLMFSRRENAKVLLFEFGKAVKISLHSLFVFFPFLVIWLDEEDKMVDVKIVKSFRMNICPEKKFCKIIEIPMNESNRDVWDLIVGDRKV